MIIIGEKINSTRSAVRSAVQNWDADGIIQLARLQAEAGSNYIDVNAGTFPEDEPQRLKWLVEIICPAVDVPLCIDTPNSIALAEALKAYRGPKPLINSITGEKERWNGVMPLVQEYGAGVIALTMDDEGVPESASGRLKLAERLVNGLVREGVECCDIFVDPLVRPISTGDMYGRDALDAMAQIRREFPEVHITGGLSNVSFGLPGRKLLNTAFLVCAMANGLDCAILDPMDSQLLRFIFATNALLGYDEYCAEYIEAFRDGLLV